ncbi:MAG: HEAT repeat domain-containing protein [Methanolinea sp.]|nr:HEAT repeat domain-containing protein [Methanolinea sp.]
MKGLSIPWGSRTDIPDLERRRDLKGLIRLLSDPSFEVQWRSAEALGRIGSEGLDKLHAMTRHRQVPVRIGITEALGEIGNPESLPFLANLLTNDRSNEVRWAAALALGQLKDAGAIPCLSEALRDPDKYVRYGAARALLALGWSPANEEETVIHRIAAQQWEEISHMPGIPVNLLIPYLKDRDSRIRIKVVETLGEIGDPAARIGCDIALQDKNPDVRWTATMAFSRGEIPLLHLPRALSRRERIRKNPYIASFLNFFFLGLGYNYLGMWWGFLLFQVNTTSILVLSLLFGPFIPYMLSYSLSAVSVLHTWHLVGKMPDI